MAEQNKSVILILSISLGFSLLLVVVVLGGYFFYLHWIDSNYDSSIQKLKNRGYPTNLEELDKWYTHVPENENAAPIYQKAFDEYLEVPKKDEYNILIAGLADYPDAGKPVPEKVLKASRKYLETNAKTLEYIRKGNTYSRCRYPIDLPKGIDTLYPHLSLIRKCARLFSLESFFYAKADRTNATLDSCINIIKLGNSLKGEPNFISFLINCSCQAIAMNRMMNNLSMAEFTIPQLKKFDAELVRWQPLNEVPRIYIAECIVFMNLHKNSDFMDAEPGIKVLDYLGIMKKNRIKAIDTYLEAIDILKKPSYIAYPEIKQLEKKTKSLGFQYFLFRTISNIEAPARSSLKIATHILLMRTILAIECYRIKNKKLPDKLSDIVPDFLNKPFLDPFSGKPLGYKKMKDEYIVYSIGPDMVDNGGAAFKDYQFCDKPGYDLVLKVLNRKHKNGGKNK